MRGPQNQHEMADMEVGIVLQPPEPDPQQREKHPPKRQFKIKRIEDLMKSGLRILLYILLFLAAMTVLISELLKGNSAASDKKEIVAKIGEIAKLGLAVPIKSDSADH